MSKITIEQWRMFKAVADNGSFAQAAQLVHKSQSTVNYAVNKLQDQLGVALFEQQGRKFVLTENGRVLLRRAEQLLNEAGDIEALAKSMTKGSQPMIRLAVDVVFPSGNLFEAFDRFSSLYPYTRIELQETVLSGSSEAFLRGDIDLCITGSLPTGHLGDQICDIEFVPVAHPDHLLHQLGRPLSQTDLRQHRQVVVRDSAFGSRIDAGWLGAEQRWTVSHMHTSREVVMRGLGYAWLPLWMVKPALQRRSLAELPMAVGQRRKSALYMLYGKKAKAGPVIMQLAQLIRTQLESLSVQAQ